MGCWGSGWGKGARGRMRDEGVCSIVVPRSHEIPSQMLFVGQTIPFVGIVCPTPSNSFMFSVWNESIQCFL